MFLKFTLLIQTRATRLKPSSTIYREVKLEVQRLDQVSTFQEFYFEDVGSYEIRINDIEDLGERATIPIQVTPEFGLDEILLTAVTLGAVFVTTVRRNNNLFR
jgi:formylmethanofuran dehydrogenase subunit D